MSVNWCNISDNINNYIINNYCCYANELLVETSSIRTQIYVYILNDNKYSSRNKNRW